MSWTETARREHDGRGLRYASDCTDEEWAATAAIVLGHQHDPAAALQRPFEAPTSRRSFLQISGFLEYERADGLTIVSHQGS